MGQIFVVGESTTTYDLAPVVSVSDLKELVTWGTGVAAEDQVLTYAGKPLEDERNLSSYDICENATVSLGKRLLGGKVHGSLARAGKVKGQTPKVDKQEKKKKKTGRSKRRIQYNRRFVNVVPTFGKKNGPNANSS